MKKIEATLLTVSYTIELFISIMMPIALAIIATIIIYKVYIHLAPCSLDLSKYAWLKAEVLDEEESIIISRQLRNVKLTTLIYNGEVFYLINPKTVKKLINSCQFKLTPCRPQIHKITATPLNIKIDKYKFKCKAYTIKPIDGIYGELQLKTLPANTRELRGKSI